MEAGSACQNCPATFCPLSSFTPHPPPPPTNPNPTLAGLARHTHTLAIPTLAVPCLQATLGEPVKRNAYKAVALCYSVISIGYLLVTITGYWVSWHLPAREVLANWHRQQRCWTRAVQQPLWLPWRCAVQAVAHAAPLLHHHATGALASAPAVEGRSLGNALRAAGVWQLSLGVPAVLLCWPHMGCPHERVLCPDPDYRLLPGEQMSNAKPQARQGSD